MGEYAKGQTKKPVGDLSLGVSHDMRTRIIGYPGGIKGFSKVFGWSTRLNQLLAGRQPWTLEDLTSVCDAFNLVPFVYIEKIQHDIDTARAFEAKTQAALDRSNDEFHYAEGFLG